MKHWLAGLLNFIINDMVMHVPWHGFRLFFVRLFNKNIHPSTKLLMHSRILCPWNLVTKANVVINQFCLLDCRQHAITIGENTDIGAYTRIWTLGHNPDDDDHSLYGGAVNIGHHVWIASGATILPGVELGDGCVVAASSVVHKSVKEKTIVGGNPAKVIRERVNNLSYTLKYRPYFE